MGPETYYYLFSFVLAGGAVYLLINLLYLRLKGKTTFGLIVKSGTPERKRIMPLISNRSIAIVSAVALIFIANLMYDIYRLMHFEDQEYARGLLIYGTVGVVLFSALMISHGREQVGDYKPYQQNEESKGATQNHHEKR